MTTVTISPKFQVVIPLSVRKAFSIHPGERVQVMTYKNRIELIPLRKIKAMRGFLKGIKTDIPREKDRL